MEKIVEMMQLQLQQHREAMQAQEQRFREQADMKASTPSEARSIGAGVTDGVHFSHSTFFAV